MAGRQAALRLRGRSDGNAQGRRLVILACTMAGILFFLSVQQSSFSGRGGSRDKTLRDTHGDWTVSRAVVVTKDPIVESEKVSGNVATGDKVDAVGVDEKEEVREEEKEEEKEGVDATEAMEEAEDKDDDVNDGIGKEEGPFEGMALGDEATSNEDEASDEEAGDDGILQVSSKSFPVSLF